MAYIIQTTQEIYDRNIALFESKFGVTVPTQNKAYIRVLSVAMAMAETGNNKFAANNLLQNLAITAQGDNLDLIGVNFGVERKPAEAAVLTGEVVADAGITIAQTITFVGDSTGVQYYLSNSYTEAGGVITVTCTASDLGVVGNIEVGGTLTISTPVPGAATTMTVTVVDNVGADKETDDAYRIRVLGAIRTRGGGSNSADCREWSQSVAGVLRAFPFSGLPEDDPNKANEEPPERTVYIECTTDLDPDGIPSSALLTEVRNTIITDPDTGLENQPLGITNDTLYVEPIIRTEVDVEIDSLVVAAEYETQLKAELDTTFDNYFRARAPYVVGLDAEFDQANIITNTSLSDVLQSVLDSYNASASDLTFDVSGVGVVDTYALENNQTLKLGTITYV